MKINPNGWFMTKYMWACTTKPRTLCGLIASTGLQTLINLFILFLIGAAAWMHIKFGWFQNGTDILEKGGSQFEATWLAMFGYAPLWLLTAITISLIVIFTGACILFCIAWCFQKLGNLCMSNVRIANAVTLFKNKTCNLIDYSP